MDAARQFFDNGDWWAREGAFRLLHDINPLRLKYTAQAAGGSLAGKRLLDLGCGGGIFAEAAANAGARVLGCDISAGAITAAKAHAQKTGASVQYREGAPDMAEAGQYDILTCFEMLEHADSPAAVVADAATLLKPGGVAVFSTINRTVRAFGLMIVGLEHVLKILPPGAHEYAKFIAPEELARMCEDCGLAVERVAGMEYSFFGRVYLLREDAAPCNYFLTARRS